jgi:hypothetical protein
VRGIGRCGHGDVIIIDPTKWPSGNAEAHQIASRQQCAGIGDEGLPYPALIWTWSCHNTTSLAGAISVFFAFVAKLVRYNQIAGD